MMRHGRHKRRYVVAGRQYMTHQDATYEPTGNLIHHDAVYEPTGVKRELDYLNHPTAAIVKEALQAIGLRSFLCLLEQKRTENLPQTLNFIHAIRNIAVAAERTL